MTTTTTTTDEARFVGALDVTAVVVVALLVLALVGVALSRRDEGAPAGLAGPGRATSAAHGSDPALRTGAVVDTFAGTGRLQGGTTGPAWHVVRGVWSVADGEAHVRSRSATRTTDNLATIDVGSADLRAEVTLTGGQPGASIAFRVVDDEDYWLFGSTRGYATYSLVHVVHGVPKVVTNSGLTKLVRGAVVGVHASGRSIEVLVDGVVRASALDPEPAGTRIGLATSGGGAGDFSRFTYRVG